MFLIGFLLINLLEISVALNNIACKLFLNFFIGNLCVYATSLYVIRKEKYMHMLRTESMD